MRIQWFNRTETCWEIWMKSRTECRYWMEFYHYEQWLIDNDYVSSRECYSMTKRMGDEYLNGLSEYVQMMKKRYKENTVRVKVSRLTLFLKSVLNKRQCELLRIACLIWCEISSVSSKHIRSMRIESQFMRLFYCSILLCSQIVCKFAMHIQFLTIQKQDKKSSIIGGVFTKE